ELGELWGVALEDDAMLAHRACRAGDSVDRHRQLTAAAAPPLTQVLQPLRAVFFLRIGLIPDGQVRSDALIGILDPDRDIRTVIFGNVDSRNLDANGKLPCRSRRGCERCKYHGDQRGRLED